MSDLDKFEQMSRKNYSKINTKNDLVELLKGYKGILSNNIIDYLNKVIELEFSVIREYISIEDRMALSELEGYRKIAIYNVYNRALNLLKSTNMNLDIQDNIKGFDGIHASVLVGCKNITLFDFHYGESIHFNQDIPNGDKAMKIGTISLYQTLENEKL